MSEISHQSKAEFENHELLKKYAIDLFPQYGSRWDIHSVVTMRRQALSRLIYYNDLYKKILDVPGVVCEFGVQWGETLTTLINLRGMYEPYNISRKIIGFDTFEGLLSIDEKDGDKVLEGDYSTFKGYEKTLEEILTLQESFSPISHIKKFELVKGHVWDTVPDWLNQNKQTIISMAIFDMDIYIPTKKTLENILPYLIDGSLLVFDELNHPDFPGETLAVAEVLDMPELKLRRHPHQPYCAWAIYRG